MKKYIYLLSTSLIFLFFSNKVSGQVTIFPGEAPVETVYQKNGDFGPGFNSVGAFSTNFNRARGIISVGCEVQSDGYASWDYIDIHFYYNGNWVHVLRSYNVQRNGDAYESSVVQNTTGTPSCHGVKGAPQNPFQLAWYGGPENRCVHTGYSAGFADRENNYYVRNLDNLKRYNGFSYLPITGGIVDRAYCNQDATWTLQFDAYSSSKIYPVYNGLDPASNISSGYNATNVNIAGNITGIQYVQWDPQIGAMVFNISNVPPEMLSASSFKVRSYAHSVANNHNRVCITTYNNENPMKTAPMGLTASNNICGSVKLTWSNSSNTLPAEDVMYLKNVIFRNGVYLATVNDNVTTYTDATAMQDSVYSYTVRHVAFTTLGKSYYQSNPSNTANGNVKPRPDIPISPSATSNRCNGEIELTWQHNGTSPQYFKIERATSTAGPYTVLTSTLAGTERLFLDNTVTRGQQYFYKISSISDCNVNSAGAAGISGISPSDPAMATSVTAISNTVTGTVDLTWQDNANNETKYQVVRTDDEGNTVLTDINPNQTSYNDASAAACRLYTYKIRVFNDCVLSGIVSTSQATVTLPPPNLGNTFTSTKKLTASKGYFSNRVELSWSNNNGLNIDIFKIYRKQLGTTLDSVQIAAPNAGSGLYVDNTADARVFYRYTIVGVKQCNGSDLLTNISSDIGFRNPTGIVSGHIEYNGGVAVNGAKVFVQQSSATLAGNSLKFSPTGTLSITDGTKLEPGAQMRCEFWMKPTVAATGNILNKANAFSFGFNGTNWVAGIFTGTVQKIITAPTSSVTINNWNHISMVYNGSAFKLFINGVYTGSVAATGNIDDTNNDLIFGSAATDFYLDEFRLIGQSQFDSIISTDANRILNGDETSFKCNLHFNENVGNFAYDVSKIGNFFNENHAVFTGTNVTWSTDIPTSSQLGYFGVTNALGNYVVSGIQYLGSGENFNLVPNYQTHSFSPNSRSVYIGDGTNVYNNQDFTDISSFPVTGTLYYKGTTCPVPNADLKLDGTAIIANGIQAQTDANGTFSISVPIGNHYISVSKTGHDMVLGGRYPVTGIYNFQAPVSGIQFKDSTLRKVVGRVVGGDVEGDKIANLGKSKNNIGKAYVQIATPLTGTPCFTTAVITNTATGEFEFNVPPVQYKITQAYVINNSVTINMNTPNSLKFASNTFDLTNALFQKTEKDSLFVTLGSGSNQRDSLIGVDSVKYHHRIDFIHYSSPTLGLYDTLGNRFIGEKYITLPTTPSSTVSAVPTSSLNWGPLEFPVFKQNNFYKAKITAVQTYTNADAPSQVDTVKLNGLVTIANNLIDGPDPNPNVSLNQGVAYYSFKCGSPNTATYTPNFLSYTKAMQINITPEGQPTYSLSPNATTTVSPGYNMYRAYVIGSLMDGTGFATVGPERVDMILRDPPGSGSSSTWSSGTSTTKVENIYNGGGVTQGISAEISVGTKQTVGLGVGIEIDISADVELGMETQISGGTTNGYTETVTTMNEVSTRDDADYVGAEADIFVGRSRNWYMGPTINLELRPASTCTLVECVGPIVSGYRLAKISGLSLAPGEVKTRFSYTQKEIEETVIPTLEALRTSFFTRSGSRYTTTLTPSDSRFGSNNDDPLWGAAASSTTPAIFEKTSDRSGPSYNFNYATGTFTTITYVNNNTIPPSVSTATLAVEVEDSVRIINNQIRLWKEALRDNEKEKFQCVNNTAGTLVDNFSLGSAILNNSYSVTFENAEEKSFEFSLDASATYTVKAKIGNTGGEFEGGTTLNYSRSVNTSTSTTTENTFQYTLTDGDPGDLMSVDVYRMPMGNVFITRGGQTMCPYEDALVLHYFNPSNPSAWISSHTYNPSGYQTISPATIKREVPDIVIDGSTSSTKLNIPSNQAAVFQVQLSNQSLLTVNNSVDLQVRVANTSNPNGAILKIDGQNANAIFNIPSGGSLNKVLTVERGPVEIEYDSLMVIFSSACSEDIADTAYVSVHFIPTCTDLEFNTPVNNFIINNSNNSLANVIIDGYNYNYGVAQNTSTLTSAAHPYYGLEKIGFEIKPGNTSQWLQIQEFYKYPTAAGSNSLYPIPNNQVYTQYNWTVTPQSYADGNYEIRAVSYCYNKDGSYATVYSPVHSGVMDRVNPHPFGTPTPGDGILDPNDDISIKFNEPIDISSLSYVPVSGDSIGNFDIRGVLNGADIRHSESLNFDGTADYAEVTGGAGLQKRPFTFEFWAKFNPTGAEQTAISQGTDPNQFMTIGFDAANRLKFSLGNQTALSTSPVSLPTDWHHYVVSYDYQNADASLYIDGSLAGTNNNFIVDYIGSGKLAFGKAIPANNNFFNGNMHEVRLWNKVRTISEITMTMNKVLNRNQSGLVYNWKMDEADGLIAKDEIRSRDANIYGATWEVNPNGNAAQFDGADDNLKISSGNIAINKEMDFTLEFWFNSNQAGVSTLFSNGAGVANTADSLNAWTIQKDAAGKIHVYHKGLDFVAVNTNYFDNNWHHFALVMQRTGNLSAYVDGNLQNSVQGINFNNLAGANMYLGAKATNAGATATLSDYYSGKMDEFRLWNTARKAEQIKRDKQNRMLGDEAGLMAYVPFENYALVLGTPSLTPTFNNQSQITLTVNAQNGTSLIAQTPTVKLPRPVQSVNYTWSLNNDQIILSTTTAPELIENVTLDITVQNAYDMHGNKMQSPKTWIAYINKNQVKWQDDEFNFEKTVDSVITFVAPIVNSGGAQKAYTIGGVPSWMTSSTTNGVIAPNSVQNVTFTIPAGQSVGDYNAGITVTTDFNYDEVLQINLKVKGAAPNWTVNTAAYQYQMNIFGQLKIDGVISSSTDSKLAAFCNGQIRGVANLQYVPAYDKYEVFLNVYSNSVSGDSIYFNIYDGATGLTFVTVDSSLTFVDNDVVGTVSNPRTFSANTEISRNIPLNAGWTWVSFPLKTNKMANGNLMMASITPDNGDIVTSISDYDQYDNTLGWLGNISSSTGYKNNQSYKIKKAVADTLIHVGSRLHPDSIQAQISVVPGWNWIGLIANKNLPINDALANYNAVTGDLIKSQYQFAYYDNLTGWSGSLTQMKPTLGYMLKSASTSTFSYPLSGILGARMAETSSTSNIQDVFPFTPEQYSNTMSMIIKGNICSEALAQGNVAVGVFDSGNNLRGYAYPVMTNTTYVFYLTAYSNSNSEELMVKYFNTTDASVIATNTMVTFNTDALVGTPSQPFMANVDESLSCQVVNITTGIDQIDNSLKVSVYPNPFSEQINLQFNKAVNAKMELVDVLGKVVYSSSIKGKKEVVLMNYNLADGVYYIRLTGDINKQIKVVKTK